MISSRSHTKAVGHLAHSPSSIPVAGSRVRPPSCRVLVLGRRSAEQLDYLQGAKQATWNPGQTSPCLSPSPLGRVRAELQPTDA